MYPIEASQAGFEAIVFCTGFVRIARYARARRLRCIDIYLSVMSGKIPKKFPENKEIPSLLRSHGIFPTRQRLRVAQEMLCRPQHVTADQLFMAVNAKHPAVARATVYNTLSTIVDAGLVSVLTMPDGGTVYYDSSVHHHAHIFNEESGELTDVDADVLGLAQHVALPKDVEVTGVDLVVRVRRKAAD